VTVYFERGALEVTPAGGKSGKLTVKRGETRSASAGPKAIKNTGSSELHYVHVDFLGAGESETWGKTGLAPHYGRLIEDRYTRTYQDYGHRRAHPAGPGGHEESPAIGRDVIRTALGESRLEQDFAPENTAWKVRQNPEPTHSWHNPTAQRVSCVQGGSGCRSLPHCAFGAASLSSFVKPRPVR
jgi:hypothetical protein